MDKKKEEVKENVSKNVPNALREDPFFDFNPYTVKVLSRGRLYWKDKRSGRHWVLG